MPAEAEWRPRHLSSVGYNGAPQNWFSIQKSLNVIYHVDRVMEENHIIITEKDKAKFNVQF